MTCPRRGDIDMAVAGFEHALRDRGRVIVAGLRRDFLIHQPACGLKIEHENLRLQQRGMNPLSLTGFFPFIQRDHDAVGQQDAGAQIVNRNADAHRSLAWRAGDRHQPAHALCDLVETGPVAIGTLLPENLKCCHRRGAG